MKFTHTLSRRPLYLYLKNYQYDLLGSTSSIVTAINSAMIKDMEIKIPGKESMRWFDDVAGGAFMKMRSNQLQISTLEKLRDTLLLKLMSGEVRVRYPDPDAALALLNRKGGQPPRTGDEVL